MNLVIMLGNLTRDPELLYSKSGTAICNFSIACNEKRKAPGSDQWEDQTSFFDCVAFQRTAELIKEYFGKGKPILFEGKMKQDSWDDKESGKKRSKVTIVVNKVTFLPKTRDDLPTGFQGDQGNHGEGKMPAQKSDKHYSQAPLIDDEVPF